MGTRSVTLVHAEDGKVLCALYRQFDGYPTGHGRALFDFVKSRTLVNGIGTQTEPIANGMGCLAALIVAHFKETEAGNFYLIEPSAKLGSRGTEFLYHVRFTELGTTASVTVEGTALGDEVPVEDAIRYDLLRNN